MSARCYNRGMRKASLCRLAAMATFSSLLLAASDLSQLSRVRSVYIWPMLNSFDQYLAEQISEEDVFEVVVDPKLAGAVLTDRIDAPFLAAMEEFFPLPQPDEAEKGEAKKEEDESGDSIEAGVRLQRPTNRALSRPKGTLFLVDVSSRRVLWSTFLKEFQPSPNKLHGQARDVVVRLKKQLTPGL